MIPPDTIRVLVVDDEAPARHRLIDLLQRDPSVESIEEAADGDSAIKKIQHLRPDLMFLDVQMPAMSGLEVLQRLGAMMPLTVFVTAYDQHAIQAFEANAADYLLKPFSDERLEIAMERIKQRLQDAKSRPSNHVLQPASATLYVTTPLDTLLVKSGGMTHVVRATGVDWFQAAGIYVTLHMTRGELLYRAALTDLAARLDPTHFVRVHRSAIVNIDRIKYLERVSHGEFDAVLRSGARIRVSRTYRAALERRLGQAL